MYARPSSGPGIPQELQGAPLGMTGIPSSRLPGIARGFGDDGIVYILRLPRRDAIKPDVWKGLELEDEWTIPSRAPPGSVVGTMRARDIAPLTIDHAGRLISGHSR